MLNLKQSKLYITFRNTRLYLWLLKIKPEYRKVIVSKKTKLVIEGFPRSANTFAYNVFEKSFLLSGENPQFISHHVHSTVQITYAIKHEIPVIVLIRNPLNAISSLIIKKNGLLNRDLRQIIDKQLFYYILFYRKIECLKEKVLIVSFQEITNNYDLTLKRANEKFKREYYVLKPSNELTKELLNKIKQTNIKKVNYNIKELAIPSELKLNDKKLIEPIIKSSKLYQKAQEIYNKY